MENDSPVIVNKKRSLVLSILLSVITPGLGHLYNGNLRMAIVLPSLFIIITNIIYQSSLIKSFIFLLFLVSFAVCFYLFVIIHASILSSRNKNYVLKTYNRVFIYVLWIIFFWGINEFIPTNDSIRTFSIPTFGMENTLMVDDFILVDMEYYENNNVKRNDLIIFSDPEFPQNLIIKRVLGLGNERLSILNGIVSINGQPLQESNPNLRFENDYLANFDEIIIPGDHFFVLGDNRPDSRDSRMFGPISKKSIKGKPLYIYFDNSFERIGLEIK